MDEYTHIFRIYISKRYVYYLCKIREMYYNTAYVTHTIYTEEKYYVQKIS